MRWFRFVILIISAAVLQAGFLDNWHIKSKPDLLLILLVFFAVYSNTSEAVIASFTIGFVADIITRVMGPQMISFGLFGAILAYLQRFVAVRKMPYQAAVIFVVGLAAYSLAYLLAFIKDRASMTDFYRVILWTSLTSGLVGPFLFLPAAWWMRIRIHRFRRD